QVEVCQQRVHRAKLIAGINEKFSATAFGSHVAVRIGCALQRACGRSADGYDARAGSFRLVDLFGRLVDYFITLRRYYMFFDLFDANRLKSRIAYMMRDFNDLHAARAQFVEDSRGEMQSGGRRRNRSALTGEDGLIPRLVQSPLFAAFALNVGRQRRIADLVNDPVEVAVAFKTDLAAAFFGNGGDDAAQ